VYETDYSFTMNVMEEIFLIRSCIEILAIKFKIFNTFTATDEYTRHSVHVTQPYTGTTGHNQLAPWQN